MTRTVQVDAERLLRRLRAKRGSTQVIGPHAAGVRLGLQQAIAIVLDEMERAGREES